LVCDGCGRDEAACTCAAAGLLDFLSDFQGRPKRHFVPVAANGSPVAAGSVGVPGAAGLADLPGSAGLAGSVGMPGAEPSTVGGSMAGTASGAALAGSGHVDPDAGPAAPRAGSPVPRPGQAPTHHVRPAAAAHGRLPGASLLDFSGGNTLATASVVLASLSLLMPLLAIAGVAAGIVTLQREKEAPWMRGRARAAAAIVLSLILAPVSLAIWISVLTGS
jgi:hypothetical protein